MDERTRTLWTKQDRHVGDRERLFRALATARPGLSTVLYAGSYVDVAPSFVCPDVTYVDLDRRAARFFSDHAGVDELLAEHGATGHRVRFIHGSYADALELDDDRFDLLVSLYAGPVSEHCTRYLRPGGHLLVNPSHGDAALASIDPRYRLAAVVESSGDDYSVTDRDLDQYLVPKRDVEVTAALIHETGRGVAYTKSPFAYVFERVASPATSS